MRKYVVRNTLTGHICFGGRRFWTARDAAKQIQKSGMFAQFMEIRKFT